MGKNHWWKALMSLHRYRANANIGIDRDIWIHSGFTVPRTFESPSFTVGVCFAVVLAWELQYTRDQSQCVCTAGDVKNNCLSLTFKQGNVKMKWHIPFELWQHAVFTSVDG